MDKVRLSMRLLDIPTVRVDRGLFVVTLPISTEKAPKIAAKVKIENAPLSRLESALDNSIHVRIVSQSGGGKTTLLGNLINYCVKTYLEDFTLSDPKGSDPKVWGDVRPDHYEYECLDHVFSLGDTAMKRIKEATAHIRKHDEAPDFEPQFHIIDELELLYGLIGSNGAKKEHTAAKFKGNVKTILKVGREHKIKLLFVTQSPLCTDINVRKNDLENCSSIFLGTQISAALNSTDDDGLLRAVPSEMIAKLKAENRARLDEIAQKRKELGIEDDLEKRIPQEFYYLFFDPAHPHQTFMGLMPPKGHYSSPEAQNQIPQKSPVSSSPAAPTGGAVVIAPKELEHAGNLSSSGGSLAVASDLSALLAAGTQCPKCGSLCTSYKVKKPNGKGNVFPECKNSECSKKSFKWNPLTGEY